MNTKLSLLKFGCWNSIKQVSNYHFGTNFPFKAVTIDATYRCNLNCSFCYYARNKAEDDVSVDEWLSILQGYKEKGYKMAFWAGGEPGLRKVLLEKGSKLFLFNIVFSNGIRPLLDLPNLTYYISIDGDRETHNKLRKNSFDIVKKNIQEYKKGVVIACTINKLNQSCISKICEEWCESPGCRAVSFDFYTPEKEETGDFMLSDEEKAIALDKIIEMKAKYNNKIFGTVKSLELMKKPQEVTRKYCIARQMISLDAQGHIKTPCPMGSNIDCEQCGKFVPFLFHSLYNNGDLQVFSNLKSHWLNS